MKAILQRVKFAKVEVGGETVGEIGQGFLVLLGVAKEDDKKEAEVLSNKIAGLRVFTDENDKMNLSLDDIGGEVLVISNFTLCADCSHGRRPSFIAAARPEQAEPLYEYFCQRLRDAGVKKVAQGIFGADMAVSLLNDGPVTIDINSKDLKPCYRDRHKLLLSSRRGDRQERRHRPRSREQCADFSDREGRRQARICDSDSRPL